MSRTYTRTCVQCGATKQVKYKPKGTETCNVCNMGKINRTNHKERRWKDHKEVRYIYFCPLCSSIRILKAKRKSPYCRECSKTVAKSVEERGYFNMETMKFEKPKIRYFRCCKICGDVREVKTFQSAQKQYCKKCKITKNNHLARTKPHKKKSVSKAEIERQIELNRKHKESLKEKKAVIQTRSEEDMINEWLKKNQPSVVADDTEPMPYHSQKSGFCSTDSILGY